MRNEFFQTDSEVLFNFHIEFIFLNKVADEVYEEPKAVLLGLVGGDFVGLELVLQ